MHRVLPKVKVVHPTDEYMWINESDFDPKVHQLFPEGGSPAPQPSSLSESWVISALNSDGAIVYWEGDEWVEAIGYSRAYTSEGSAEGAISRTRAIQGDIDSGAVTSVEPIRSDS